MRTISKFTSVILVLALLCAFASSCDLFAKKDPTELVNAADKALGEGPYTVTASLTYTSDNEEMKAAIDSFNKTSIKTEVNGDDFKISMSFKNDGIASSVKYTFIDGVLHIEMNDAGMVTSEKLSGEDVAALTENVGANIGINDFDSVRYKKISGVDSVVCDKIKNEPLDELVQALQTQLGIAGVTVAIKNVVFTVGFADGRYATSELLCNYVITTPDAVYTLDMKYSSAYEYDTAVEITAPDIK